MTITKRRIYRIACASLAAIALASCAKKPKLTVQFPDKFDGQNVELLNYLDSTTVASSKIAGNSVVFEIEQGETPQIMQVVVDGKVQGYYISEGGDALITDSTTTATGTPLNDRFTRMIASLDSIEETDDMELYVDYAAKAYNENRGTAIGDFFALEWMKFADPEKVDSLLKTTDSAFRNRKRVTTYAGYARHRGATSPGRKFIDVKGEDASGRSASLSGYMKPGKYTLIDFWASWCPYCIKEIPELKKLQKEFPNLTIVGVAVRDLPADTREMVKKRDISWDVLYNTPRVPYDIYGFTGIPHHILISPDGTILSRGENAAQIRAHMERIIASSDVTVSTPKH